jgi:hypothetical protein
MIMANQTFAMSYPEKRTFFLEGSELLKTDTQTVYTRSITNPLGAVKYINQGKIIRYIYCMLQILIHPTWLLDNIDHIKVMLEKAR